MTLTIKLITTRRVYASEMKLLVDPDSSRLELYRRNTENQWVLHAPQGDAPLELPSIDLRVDHATIFEDTEPGAT